jgi:hypothetical protein
MVQHGDKTEDCQRLTLLAAITDFERCVNGTTQEDIGMPEPPERMPVGPATYTSVWDNGAECSSPCKFSSESNYCFDCEIAVNAEDADDADHLVDEYVTLEDGEVLRAEDGVVFQYRKDEIEFLPKFFSCFEQYRELHGMTIADCKIIEPHQAPEYNDVILFDVLVMDTGKRIQAHAEEVVKSINGNPLNVNIGGQCVRIGDDYQGLGDKWWMN